MAGVAVALAWALKLYTFLIIVWVFGSWFPHWRFQPWYRAIHRVVAPYVEAFAPLKLQFSGFDFTPIVAILGIELFRFLLLAAVYRGGFA